MGVKCNATFVKKKKKKSFDETDSSISFDRNNLPALNCCKVSVNSLRLSTLAVEYFYRLVHRIRGRLEIRMIGVYSTAFFLCHPPFETDTTHLGTFVKTVRWNKQVGWVKQQRPAHPFVSLFSFSFFSCAISSFFAC